MKIEGQMFTPPPQHYSSTNPAVIRRRKKPIPRQMLCTDIQIEAGVPEQVFIDAWNRLIDEKDIYLLEWQQAINGSDVLKAYRARELIRLLDENGYISTMPYELMLKTLDHINIVLDGKLEVIFLAGTRI